MIFEDEIEYTDEKARESMVSKLSHIAYQYQFEKQYGYPEKDLVIDCFDKQTPYGNVAMYVNDPKGSGNKLNCQFVEVENRGWPYVLLVSTKKIRDSEELLIEYGAKYWQRMKIIEDFCEPWLKNA